MEPRPTFLRNSKPELHLECGYVHCGSDVSSLLENLECPMCRRRDSAPGLDCAHWFFLFGSSGMWLTGVAERHHLRASYDAYCLGQPRPLTYRGLPYHAALGLQAPRLHGGSASGSRVVRVDFRYVLGTPHCSQKLTRFSLGISGLSLRIAMPWKVVALAASCPLCL